MSKSLPGFASLIVALGTFVSVQAVPLTTGIVPIPTPNPGTPTQVFPSPPSIIPGGFTQSWSAPAQAAWVNLGTFTANGQFPNGASNIAGTTVYDFTGPNGLGVLPVGTILRIGDLDRGGSSTETITISGTCNICSLPLGSFIDEPFGVTDATSPPPSLSEMPTVTVSGTSPNVIYFFDGTGVPSNPAISFAMTINQPLSTLTIVRGASSTNFNLMAPAIPEPASAALVGIGGLLVLARRRNAVE